MANKFVLSDFVVKLTADTKQAMKGLTDFETKMDAIAKKMEKSSLGKAVGSKNKQASKQLDKEVKDSKKANDAKAKDKQNSVAKSESKIRKEFEKTAKVQKRIDDIQKGADKYQERLKANFKRKRKLDTTSTPAEKGKETKAFNARLRSIQARADKMSADVALKSLTSNPINDKVSERANAGVFQQKLKQSHEGFKQPQQSKAMSSYYKKQETLAKKAEAAKVKLDNAARKAKEKVDIASEKAKDRRIKSLGLRRQARLNRSKDLVTESASVGAENYRKRLQQVKTRLKETKKIEDAARKVKERSDLAAMKAKEKADKASAKARDARNKAQGLRVQARIKRSKDFVTDSSAIGSANYKKRLDQVRAKLTAIRKEKEKAEKKSQTILHDHHVKKRYDLEAKQRAADKKLISEQTKQKETAHAQALAANSRLDKQRQKAADRIDAENKSRQHRRDVKHAKAIADNNKFDRQRAAKAAAKQAAAIKAAARESRALAAAQERAAKASMRLADNTRKASVSMRKLAAYGLSLYTLADQLKKAFVTGFKIESAEAGMKAIMSTMEDITSRPATVDVSVDLEMAHAQKVALKFGRTIDTVSDSWMRMIASNRGKMPIDQLRRLQEGVLSYGTVTGMTEDRAKNAFLAINQMMSKGVVQSEELKRQLSEHMPGALGIFAKSVGVSEADLYKMMAAGELVASETLPLFAEELIRTSQAGGALDQKLESTRVTVGRLNAALSIARVKFFKGSDTGLSKLAKATQKLLVTLFPWIETLGALLGSILTDISLAIDWLNKKLVDLNEALGGQGTEGFTRNLLEVATVLKSIIYLFAGMLGLKLGKFIARLFGVKVGIASAVKSVGKITFQGIFTKVLSGLFSMFGALKNLFVTGLLSSLGAALRSVASMIPALLGRITLGWVGLLVTAIWTILDTFFPNVTEAVKDVVGNFLSVVYDGVVDVLKLIASPFIFLYEGLSLLFSYIIDSVSGLVRDLAEPLNFLFDILSKVLKEFSTGLTNLFNLVRSPIDAVFEGISNIIDSILEGLSDLLSIKTGSVEELTKNPKYKTVNPTNTTANQISSFLSGFFDNPKTGSTTTASSLSVGKSSIPQSIGKVNFDLLSTLGGKSPINVNNTIEVGVTGDVNDSNARTLGNSIGNTVSGNMSEGYGLEKLEN